MIQTYSNNVSAGAGASIPLENVSVIKGLTSTKEGNTIELNRCGVYMVHVNGSVTVPTGGTVTVQMRKDGVILPDALATITATADNIIPFEFDKLVQVPFSNTPAPCTASTSVDVISSVEATYNHINVIVTKLV